MNSADTSRSGCSDPDLMKQAAGGSDEAFAELIRRYQSLLVNYFYRLGVYNDAEDLTQETFLRLFKSRGRYREQAQFKTYLYVLARNVWIDRLRQLTRREKLKNSLETEAQIEDRVVPVPAGQGCGRTRR